MPRDRHPDSARALQGYIHLDHRRGFVRSITDAPARSVLIPHEAARSTSIGLYVSGVYE
jgi:hypothetical protein